MPILSSKSCLTGFCALKHNRATLVAVSSPERVVKSMQVTARRSQAACHCFFTDRRVFSVSARRLTAGRLTLAPLIHCKSRGIPGLRCKWDDILSNVKGEEDWRQLLNWAPVQNISNCGCHPLQYKIWRFLQWTWAVYKIIALEQWLASCQTTKPRYDFFQ